MTGEAPATKNVPARKLSLKQEQAAKKFVGDAKGNKTEACREAGYATTTAEHQASRVFAAPAVQAEIGKLLAEADMTDAVVIKRHRTLIDAETWFPVGRGEDARVEAAPDNFARLGACKLFYELTGRLKQRVEIDGEVRHVVEQVVQVIQRHVPDAAVVTAIIDDLCQSLSQASRNRALAAAAGAGPDGAASG
jgi:hypothetical protein